MIHCIINSIINRIMFGFKLFISILYVAVTCVYMYFQLVLVKLSGYSPIGMISIVFFPIYTLALALMISYYVFDIINNRTPQELTDDNPGGYTSKEYNTLNWIYFLQILINLISAPILLVLDEINIHIYLSNLSRSNERICSPEYCQLDDLPER